MLNFKEKNNLIDLNLFILMKNTFFNLFYLEQTHTIYIFFR